MPEFKKYVAEEEIEKVFNQNNELQADLISTILLPPDPSLKAIRLPGSRYEENKINNNQINLNEYFLKKLLISRIEQIILSTHPVLEANLKLKFYKIQ